MDLLYNLKCEYVFVEKQEQAMGETETWRELLGEIISDEQEKQRLVETLKINPVTIMRWVAGPHNPRPDKLQQLLRALPDYRIRLLELLKRDFPNFKLELTTPEMRQPEISSEFYDELMHIYSTTLPAQARISIREKLLEQVRDHLDAAGHGLIVLLLQCVKPRAYKKVRSLRKLFGRGSGASWQEMVEKQPSFVGIETQVGDAVVHGRYMVVCDREEQIRLYPDQYRGFGESVIACPIMFGDGVAGCLLAVSILDSFFTSSRIELIRAYADLASLGFDEQEDFYPLRDLDLGVMPYPHFQKPHLETFSLRVSQLMQQAQRNGELIRRPDAEEQVWQEIEETLLQQK
jgi:hypothetical protein